MKEADLCLLKKLGRLLPQCWSRETSAIPENWAERDLAVGQCAVTVLVLQDIFGGEIQRYEILPPGFTTVIPGEKLKTHYTIIIDGREYDFTSQQFPEGVSLINRESRTRQQLLRDYPNTMYRYALLALKLAKLLIKESDF